MRKIIGNTVGMGLPKPNLMQTDPSKGDFVKGKEEFIQQNSGGSVKIPETLPNPQPLTFTGAVDVIYDGSKPVEVEIPQGGGGGETWEILDDTTLTEAVASYVKTFDAPMKKLLAIVTPNAEIATGWKYITLNSNGNYPFPIKNIALTKTERLVISIEDDEQTGFRFIEWYVAEGYTANGAANATKNGSGVHKIPNAGVSGYAPGKVNAFGITTEAMLVVGANILIKGVRK